jgi:hypothetical protein
MRLLVTGAYKKQSNIYLIHFNEFAEKTKGL